MEKTHHAIATRSREILHPRSRSFPDAEAEASFEILRDSLGGSCAKSAKPSGFQCFILRVFSIRVHDRSRSCLKSFLHGFMIFVVVASLLFGLIFNQILILDPPKFLELFAPGYRMRIEGGRPHSQWTV